MPKLKKYKVLLSAKIFKEESIQAHSLKEAQEMALKIFGNWETDNTDCDILPTEKYYWKVDSIEPKHD